MWRIDTRDHRRRTALMRVVDQATRTGDYRTPWRAVPAVWSHYKNEAEVLRALQRMWSVELGGAMFAALRSGDGDVAQDLALAYTDALAAMHGVHGILEAHADHPAIAAERRKEAKLLASAGLRFSKRSVA